MEREWDELLYQIDKISKKTKKISSAAGLTRQLWKTERNILADTECTLLNMTVRELIRGRGIKVTFLAVGAGTLTVTITAGDVTDTLTYTVYPASAVLCRRLDGADPSVRLTVKATGGITYAEAGAELVDLREDNHG